MKKILLSVLLIAFMSCGDKDVQQPIEDPQTLEQWLQLHPGMTEEKYNQLLEAGHVPPYPPPPEKPSAGPES